MKNRAKSVLALSAVLLILAGAGESPAMMFCHGSGNDSSGLKMETLLQEPVASGMFGGPVVKFMEMKGHFAALAGGRAVWVLNHQFTLGGAGYGLVTRPVVEKTGPDTTRYLRMGYGGVEIGYIFRPEKLVNFSATLLLGGGVMRHDRTFHNYDMNGHEHAGRWGSFLFVAEPSVSAGLNVTKYFRVYAGAGYLYINGLNAEWISAGDLDGPSGHLGFVFGWF